MGDARPTILVLCGPSMTGKTHMVERILGVEYDVATERGDGISNQAANAIDKGGLGVPGILAALRDGQWDAETADRYYEAHDQAILRVLARARKWRVTPVFEGYTFMFEPQILSVHRAAQTLFGSDVRVVRAFVHTPYPQWAANFISRAEERGRTEIPIRAIRRQQWEQRVRPPAAVSGIEDRTIETVSDLHDLAAELGIRRHKWYQGFEIGPVQVKSITSAHEKIAAIAPGDIVDKTVIDLCCATAVTGMIMRLQGAKSVTAIESHPGRVGKAHELAKVLRRHAGFPRDGLKIVLGDAFDAIKGMRADTVVMLGALHYFEDYEGVLRQIAAPATDSLYVEVLLTDRGEGRALTDTSQTSPLTTFERKNGSRIHAPDTPTFAAITATALPDFDLVSRVASQGLGSTGPDTYREVWGFKRR